MQLLFFHGLQFEDSSDLHLSLELQGWLLLAPDLVGQKLSRCTCLVCLLQWRHNTGLQEDIGQMLDCPIILVGHSFGGLVIKQLYHQAHNTLHRSREGFDKAKLKNFLDNIRGIFYYATPHRGSELVEKWVEKMAKTQANPLLKYIQTLSTEAAGLNSEFDDVRGRNGELEVLGLAEGLKTKLRGFTDAEMVVPESSARDGNLYTVNGADHFSICQPENETSASFLKLKAFIDNIAGDAEARMQVKANNRKEAKAHEDNRFDNRQHLPESIVGIEVPVQAVRAKLDKAARVGIVGMGGLGKTTLAKAIFNKSAAEFEYSCFVLEVKKIEVNENTVKEKVWEMMHRRGKKDTSPESRFIVTSRDQQLLGRLDDVFDVSLLDKSTARQLFVSHAFAKQEEPQELHSFVDKIVLRCGGLPLSLEVVGKSLYRRGYQGDWEQTEHALATADGDWTNLNEKLWAILRVSYDRLTEKEQKIFLDVTTFFSGNVHWTLQEAKAAWRVVYDTKIERLLWQTLVNLSLVYNVAEDETIKVHEQLQSLGRKIASEQRQDLEGIAGLDSLQKTTGLDEKAIFSLRLGRYLNTVHPGERIYIASSALQRLGDVRYMNVDDRIRIDGAEGCEPVPTKLTLLKCASPQLSRILFRSTLCKSLAGLKLWDGEDLRVRKETLRSRVLHEVVRFSQLEILELSECRCESLPETFGQLKKLRRLVFQDCNNLCTQPESFGQLEALSYLQFRDCQKLNSLPDSFGNLSSLNHLEFSGHPGFDNLPQSFGELQALNYLTFEGCYKLLTLPNSFGNLSSLKHLEFQTCDALDNLPESLGKLQALNYLKFGYCDKLRNLPNSFGNLSSLNRLEFYWCDALDNLPESLGELQALNYLKFTGRESCIIFHRDFEILPFARHPLS